MPITEKQLFEECAKGRRKTTDVKTYAEVWSALCKWIFYQFERGKGAQLGNFIKLTWQVEELGEQKVLRPLMLLMEGYARAHGLQHRKLGPGDPEPMHAEELNFAKIAIRFSSVLQKDTVFTATRDMFHRMGSMLASRDCKFDMAIGFLTSKDRKVDFVFDSKFHKRAHAEDPSSRKLSETAIRPLGEHNGPMRTPSVAASDEKYTFVDDDDDALSAHVREHFSDDQSVSSQNMAKASPLKIKIKAQEALAESAVKLAFERHLGKLKDHDIVDKKAIEVTEFRNKNKDDELQRREQNRKHASMELKSYLEEQIKQKQLVKEKERIMNLRSTAAMPWSTTAFPAEPDHGPIHARKIKERENLRHVLAQQVNANARKKELERERQLEEDRLLMARVNKEMQAAYYEEIEHKEQMKHHLIHQWKKQSRVKELERIAILDPTNPVLENPTLHTPLTSRRESVKENPAMSVQGLRLNSARPSNG